MTHSEPSKQFWELNELTETFLLLCQFNHIPVWAEHKTLLGLACVGGIALSDTELTLGTWSCNKDKIATVVSDPRNSESLITPLSKSKLLCDVNCYNDPDGRVAIRMGNNGDVMIRIVFYGPMGNSTDPLTEVHSAQSEETKRTFAVPGDYTYGARELLPFGRSLLCGMLVHTPAATELCLQKWYGANWKAVAGDTLKQWNPKCKYLGSPIRLIEEVNGASPSKVIETTQCATLKSFQNQPNDFDFSNTRVADPKQLKALSKTGPIIFRKTSFLSQADEKYVAKLLEREPKNCWGYYYKKEENSDRFWKEVSGAYIFQNFKSRTLDINVVDSPCTFGSEVLPSEWYDYATKRLRTPEKDSSVDVMSYVVTVSPKLTPFHVDPIKANGWMKLAEGFKIWWCVSGEDLDYLGTVGYDVEKLFNVSSYSELLRLANGFLYGKLQMGWIEGGDLLWFPITTLHKVYTLTDSIGLGGYL